MKLKVYLLMSALILCCLNGFAQQKKQSTVRRTTTASTSSTQQSGNVMKFRQVGEDGYVWYKLKRGNLCGVRDGNGNNIIPIKYNDVIYCCKDGTNYFVVSDDTYSGIYDIEGTYIIPIEKKFYNINIFISKGNYSAPHGMSSRLF